MHVFFSAGEPSGDQHGAHLMRELRRRDPNIRFSGFGGPRMTAEGFDKLHQLTDLAVMGFIAVVPLIWTFYKIYRKARAYIAEHRPDAVVLIDFPGFNWWIAKAARRHGVRVLYYCPPQIWAWGPWRIFKARRLIDHVLSVLPFEAEWYRVRNVSVEYVGHPFFDEVAMHSKDEAYCQDLKETATINVGVLPGSRKSEVMGNFPPMLEVIRRLHQKYPNVRFRVACYRERQREFCRSCLTGQYADLPVDLYVGRTSEIIATVDCCLMVSGSVSLEVLANAKPAVVLYRIGKWTKKCKWFFIQAKYFALPNLIAGRELLPECLIGGDPAPEIERMTQILDQWLGDPAAMAKIQREMAALREHAAQRGGLVRAAEAILSQLKIAAAKRSPNIQPTRAAA
jgi:lipid-A-disaccharide synthase